MEIGVEKKMAAGTGRPRAMTANGPTRRRAAASGLTGRPARERARARLRGRGDDVPDGAAEAVAAEPPARTHPWFAFFVAAGVAVALLLPCAAWADEAAADADFIAHQAALAADAVLVDGVEVSEAAAEPKEALDDNGLPEAAAQRAAAAAAAQAADQPSAAAPSADAAQASPAAAPPQGARTVNVAGTVVSYVDSYQSASAPSSGAGLWMGSDSTTDGSWAYFIGHNPGPFSCVMGLGQGAAVTVCDGSGNARTYHVVDVFTVPDTTYWEEIQGRVTGHGESVILQTCVGDHASYRIVVAA